MYEKIEQDTINKVIAATDIVDTISRYVQLKNTGGNFKGLCPFHNEKTPSFVVSQQKQIFHCFGCHVGGNVVSFLIKLNNFSLKESLQYLASRYSITIDWNERVKASEADILKDNLFKINKKTLDFFTNNLKKPSGKKALEYIKARGISQKAIEKFKIGFALPKWDGLIKHINSKSNKDFNLLLSAGLVKKSESNKFYDVFRDRIIFPIFDVHDRVIGFGGRILHAADKKIPKYLNSPETSIYSKGKNIYGLNFSKDYIREKRNVVIVEGYLDYITAYQNGIKNLAATSGTALTISQVQLLKRYTNEAVIIFDGDVAGQAASERGYNNLFNVGGVDVKVVSLPLGSDPDSFLKKHGVDEFKVRIKESKPFIEYLIETITKTGKNTDSIEDQIQKVKKILFFLKDIPNVIERASYLSYISEKVGISDKALLKEMEKVSVNGKNNIKIKAPLTKGKKIDKAEFILIHFMLSDINTIERIKENIKEDDFADADFSKLTGYLFRLPVTANTTSGILDYISKHDKELATFASRAVMERLEFDDSDRAINDCIKKIRNKKLKNKIDFLTKRRKEIIKQEDFSKTEYDKLQKEYKDLKKQMMC